ncbi:MAG: AmmeMemoRadiSam system protein B [Chloroflexi bacterium]|nr:AmmeMemoRadiSam system protein B [Chloroflexota bacterium]
MSKPLTVRPSPLAGRWYPRDPEELATLVDHYLNVPNTRQFARPIGVLVPHAGIIFSGSVAGKAFSITRDLTIDSVVIVGPSHHPYPARLLSTAHSHYETPLGRVPVAVDLVEALESRLGVRRVANDPEHAIEIELPFLQQALKGTFNLLPIAMIDQSWETSQQLGKLIAELIQDRQTLLVASSDLSHFYPQEEANRLDRVILDAVADYAPQAVIQADEQGQGFACGRGAIAATMVAAQRLGASAAEIVGYATSGDATGDMSRVVGYGAALFN